MFYWWELIEIDVRIDVLILDINLARPDIYQGFQPVSLTRMDSIIDKLMFSDNFYENWGVNWWIDILLIKYIIIIFFL